MSRFSNTRNCMGPFARLGAIAALLAAGAAHAADTQPMVLSAFLDAPAGRKLAAGQIDAAIGMLEAQSRTLRRIPAATLNNQCVAYTAKRDFAKARVACDAAVAAAKAERPTTNVELGTRKDYRERIAVAYANRAVMRWLSKDAVNAAEDLATAHTYAPKADCVARNLAALQSRRAVAQVSAR